LLLMTNDGDFAQRIAHPRYGCEKTYRAKVKGVPDERTLDRLRAGVILDGRRTRPCRIVRLPSRGLHGWLEIRLREGRNQQIRRMFRFAGHPVLKLLRLAVGPVELGSLKPGEIRELTRAEVRALSHSSVVAFEPIGGAGKTSPSPPARGGRLTRAPSRRYDR
jgi:23S rRNA pseudouridine2605 synthase